MKSSSKLPKGPSHKIQHARLAKCVIFAVNFLYPKGGGMVYRSNPDKGEPSSEHWLTYFQRVLKDSGVEWDNELLDFGRASQKDRKIMLATSPTLKKKLEARKSVRPTTKQGGGK